LRPTDFDESSAPCCGTRSLRGWEPSLEEKHENQDIAGGRNGTGEVSSDQPIELATDHERVLQPLHRFGAGATDWLDLAMEAKKPGDISFEYSRQPIRERYVALLEDRKFAHWRPRCTWRASFGVEIR
jgi:hypothetical protein